MKIQIMSLVLNLFYGPILAEIPCVLFILTSSFAIELRKNKWSCATTDTAQPQRPYRRVTHVR